MLTGFSPPNSVTFTATSTALLPIPEHNAHWKLDKSKIASSTKKKLIYKALVGKAWPGKANSAKIETGPTG